MKRSFSHIVAIAAQLWTALAACVGCDEPQPDRPKPSPPGVSWTGEDTGYQSTTPTAHGKGRDPARQQANPSPRKSP